MSALILGVGLAAVLCLAVALIGWRAYRETAQDIPDEMCRACGGKNNARHHHTGNSKCRRQQTHAPWHFVGTGPFRRVAARQAIIADGLASSLVSKTDGEGSTPSAFAKEVAPDIRLTESWRVALEGTQVIDGERRKLVEWMG